MLACLTASSRKSLATQIVANNHTLTLQIPSASCRRKRIMALHRSIGHSQRAARRSSARTSPLMQVASPDGRQGKDRLAPNRSGRRARRSSHGSTLEPWHSDQVWIEVWSVFSLETVWCLLDGADKFRLCAVRRACRGVRLWRGSQSGGGEEQNCALRARNIRLNRDLNASRAANGQTRDVSAMVTRCANGSGSAGGSALD
jgi:hypothetical protein